MISPIQTKKIRVTYLFAAPLVFSFLCFVQLPSREAIARTSFDNPVAFLTAYLIAGLLTYIAFTAAPRLRGNDSLHVPALFSILPVVAGMGLSFLFDAAHFGSSVQIPIGGALIGVGSALLFLSWGQAFSLLDKKALIPTAAAMFAIAYALKLAFAPFASTQFNLAIIGCAVIASGLPLDSLLGKRALRRRSAVATVDPASDTSARIGSTLLQLWKPLFGCILCCMVWGFTWGNSFQGAVVHATGAESVMYSDLGKLGAALFLLGYGLKQRKYFDPTRGFLLPVAAGCLLLGWMLAGIDSPIMFIVIGLVSAFGFATFEMVLWITIAERATQRPAFCRLLFAITRALFACTILLGILAAPLIGPQAAELITPVCTVVFFILYAASSSKTNARPEKAPPPATANGTATAESPAVDLSGALPDLCSEYNLSPRESEVFFLFVKGHSAKYISEQLVVSPHTVKTHIKRIYEKMDVHSKDELIARCGGENIE